MNLLWVDLEMSGLNPDRDVILEIAALVSDHNLEVLATYHSVISHDPQKVWEMMDDWNRQQHSSSGLWQSLSQGVPLEQVQKDLIKIVESFWDPQQRVILAGSSVHHDRLFLLRHMPELAQRLHYRILDVSSWKILFENRYGIRYYKSENHRALDDIQQSINELKFYLNYVLHPPIQGGA